LTAFFLKNKTLQVIFLLYSSALIFLGRQLDVGLPNFDDAYYAQKAKEMLASGNLWAVTFGGVPDFGNPPFSFWVTSLAFKVFGVSGYAAVFFTALFGMAIVYMTYALCLHLFKSHWIAFFSAFVLIFPGMFVDSSRRGMVDITLAFCVTGAMFFFVKGWDNKRYYLLFGLMSAFAILTKSVLGGFPLAIAVVTFAWAGRWRELFSAHFIMAVVLALLLGFSWHLVSWFTYGNVFLETHFGLLIFNRGFGDGFSFSDFFGYCRDFLKNYWPWLPLALIGVVQFGKRALLEKDLRFQMLFVWVVFTFLVMSSSRNQTLRYLFMIFPALAIMTAKTVGDWVSEGVKEKSMSWMVGIVMATVVFVNATPLQVKVTLSPNSVDVRQLASVIHLNAPPGQKLGSYRLSLHNPRNALLFYSDRFLDAPIGDPLKLLGRMESQPGSTWLTSVPEFKKLQQDHPGKFYLIQATRKYAYFTALNNRDNVRYDFSAMKEPLIR
jgi:4-amino-4-deoxy-L-arabinose transferase-like glycosyltransferase